MNRAIGKHNTTYTNPHVQSHLFQHSLIQIYVFFKEKTLACWFSLPQLPTEPLEFLFLGIIKHSVRNNMQGKVGVTKNETDLRGITKKERKEDSMIRNLYG